MFKPYHGTINLSDIEIKTFYEAIDGIPNSRIPNVAIATHLPSGITVACPIMESTASRYRL